MPPRYIAYISLLYDVLINIPLTIFIDRLLYFIFSIILRELNEIYINKPLIVLNFEKTYKKNSTILLIEFIHEYIFIELNKNLFN